MTTAVWSAARTVGTSWLCSIVCPHGTTVQDLFMASMLATPTSVVNASPPNKAFTFHRATYATCDCTLVQTTPITEVLIHAA